MRDWRTRPCQPLQLRLWSAWKGADEDNIPPQPSCKLRQVSATRCVPAAQRETAILNLADENGSDEAVRSDRRDSRGLPETCERKVLRIRDPIVLAKKRSHLAKKRESWRKSVFCWWNTYIYIYHTWLSVTSEITLSKIECGYKLHRSVTKNTLPNLMSYIISDLTVSVKTYPTITSWITPLRHVRPSLHH